MGEPFAGGGQVFVYRSSRERWRRCGDAHPSRSVPVAAMRLVPVLALFGRIFFPLVGALMVAFAPSWARGTDKVPFTGVAAGAVVSALPDPGGVILSVRAAGNATHLGRFSREEILLFNPVTGTVAGSIVFTAANGDRLSGVVAGGFTSPTTAVGTYTFTGGTGRFESATGSVGFSVVTPDGIQFAVEFAGSLSSVGANKK
jgi:hypothetical protein